MTDQDLFKALLAVVGCIQLITVWAILNIDSNTKKNGKVLTEIRDLLKKKADG